MTKRCKKMVEVGREILGGKNKDDHIVLHNKITELELHRDQLQNQIEQIQASVRSTSEAQQGLMQKIEPQSPALLRTPLANIQMNTVAIADVFKKTEKDRDDLNAKLAELAVAISNAPPKSFWRFWRN